MIRMGLDGSTTSSGWCIFDDDKLIHYDKIVITDKDLKWRERIVIMMQKVATIAQKYNVEEICVEIPVKSLANVNTLEQLFSLHGAILGMASALHIKFTPIDVATWRSYTGISEGIPRKEKNKRFILKERSIKLANELYNLDLKWISKTSKLNDDDISDAILIAHTVIHKE